VIVEQHVARHPHRGRPVGERVVDPPDQRRPTVVDRDHVERPQRAVARQALGHQRADCLGQAGRGDCARVADLMLDLHGGVQLPSGSVALDQTDPEPMLAVEPRPDVLAQLVHATHTIEQHQLAGVPTDRPLLQRQDACVLDAQRLWGGKEHPLASLPACRGSAESTGGGLRRR
jgi:hypothetical protein